MILWTQSTVGSNKRCKEKSDETTTLTDDTTLTISRCMLKEAIKRREQLAMVKAEEEKEASRQARRREQQSAMAKVEDERETAKELRRAEGRRRELLMKEIEDEHVNNTLTTSATMNTLP